MPSIIERFQSVLEISNEMFRTAGLPELPYEVFADNASQDEVLQSIIDEYASLKTSA